MSTKRIPFPRRRSAALVGVGLLLAQLASAGQPARVHFNYGQDDADDLCLMWDQVQANADGNAALTGHLYHKEGGECRVQPARAKLVKNDGSRRSSVPGDSASVGALPLGGNGSKPLNSTPLNRLALRPEALTNQDIRIQYTTKGDYPTNVVVPDHVTTGKFGEFHVTLPAPSVANGVTVTAAYYGQNDEGGEPLAKASKKLETHVEVQVRDEKDAPINPDIAPASPEGTYHLHTSLVSWNGTTVPVLLPKKLEEVSRVGEVLKKEVEIQNLSVKGTDAEPGIAEVRAVIGRFTSEPVLLPFGVNAKLERVDEHKDEEIILQRPKLYNDDEGNEGYFFKNEHAQLKLTLTSLLSGKPLEGIDVTWEVSKVEPRVVLGDGITPFLSNTVGGQSPSSPDKTKSDGTVEIPVSAQHETSDSAPGAGGQLPANQAYGVGVGEVMVLAKFNDQAPVSKKIPFIDSLWLVAHPAEGAHGIKKEWTVGDTERVDMVVDGYVGVNGKSQAKRKFVPFRSDDHSVAPEPNDKTHSSGPVYFADADDVVTPSDADGKPAEDSRAGLAYRDRGWGNRLTGYFTARKEGDFDLAQRWNKTAGAEWWSQSGVTLKVDGDLSGKVVAKPKP